MKENIIGETLSASMSNPSDAVEMTLLADAASVGITTPLFESRKRVKLTPEFLRKYADTFKGMPITLEFEEDDDELKANNLVPHSKTVIGTIKDAYFDEAKQKVTTVGSLYKHYFPRTLKKLQELYAGGQAQVSWELVPDELKPLPEEGDDVFEPIAGRFTGQAIINKGADLGNAITLLASAAEEESEASKRKMKKAFPVGSFEWIGEQAVAYLTASANTDEYTEKEIVGTYADRVIYTDNGKFYELPIQIEDNNIKFSDTIEVEPQYQPLGASAAGSTEENPEAPPSTTKEAGNSNMSEIDERELEALKASKSQAEDRVGELESENTELKAEVETLKASVSEFEEFKTQVEADRAEQAANTLAASRIAEVEKITPYEDEQQKADDLEAFKTMDEKAFDIVKRTLQAAAEARGGLDVSAGSISNPFTSRQDDDGQAAQILNDPAYQQLKAQYATPKEAN